MPTWRARGVMNKGLESCAGKSDLSLHLRPKGNTSSESVIAYGLQTSFNASIPRAILSFTCVIPLAIHDIGCSAAGLTSFLRVKHLLGINEVASTPGVNQPLTCFGRPWYEVSSLPPLEPLAFNKGRRRGFPRSNLDSRLASLRVDWHRSPKSHSRSFISCTAHIPVSEATKRLSTYVAIAIHS